MVSENESLDAKCTSKVLYELTPIKSQFVLKAYNNLYPNNSLPNNLYRLNRISEACLACKYILDLGGENYCFKIHSEK